MRACALSVLMLLATASAAAGSTGIVVDSVRPGSAADRAGLEAGDVLLEWTRAASSLDPEPASGILTSPFELFEVLVEQQPRGPAVFVGTRDGEPLRIQVALLDWELDLRPRLRGRALPFYQSAARALVSGSSDEGLAKLKALAAAARARGNRQQAAWFVERASALLPPQDSPQGHAIEARAMTTDRPIAVAWQQRDLGEMMATGGECREAIEAHAQALGLRRQTAAESHGLAGFLVSFGLGALVCEDVVAAEEGFTRALVIQRRLAPATAEVATALNNLGVAALYHGDLETAEKCYSCALSIHESRTPDSLSVAQSLGNLALVTLQRGDLQAAEAAFRRSLTVKQSVGADSLDLAVDLRNLGVVAYRRGDLSSAAAHFRRVVDILGREVPDTPRLAYNLGNLAVVAQGRGDRAQAESLLERALAILEKDAPNGLGMAQTLGNLGLLALNSGDLIAAERHFGRVLTIQEELAPDSLDVAQTLDNLGRVAAGRGDWKRAEDLYLRAFAIRERHAPHSLALASSLANLGSVANQRGALAVSEEHHRRALSIRQEFAPSSIDEAESLHDLGLVMRDQGREQDALEFLARAVKALEAQEGRLGTGAEGRSAFRARHMDLFRDYLLALLASGQPDQAFQVLERSRAQALLAMLAERDLLFFADIPEELDRQRRLTAAEADRVLVELAGLSGAAPARDERGVGGLAPSSNEARRQELVAELRAIRARQDEIRARIRAASPRLAALTSPQPLDLAATLAMLEPGTLLLAYSLAEEDCHLFAVDGDRGTLEVHALTTTESALRDATGRLRRLVRRPSQVSDELSEYAEDLSEILLRPVAEAIANAERLVIVPDGPLHMLPFAALSDPLSAAGHGHLVEAKPLSVVASATVLAELKQRRRPGRQERVVGLADPVYPTTGLGTTPLLDWSTGSGITLRPLPGSRRELEDLGRLFGDSIQVWTGADATEERVKSIDRDATIVHLAVHALVNEQLPLESALVLTVPDSLEGDRDNGLLQVWEIFEEVRLDADLVTLSACQTALGEVITGEGVVGLTRAFQYAGARSVVASLWGVSDASTAELMGRFYGHLAAGSTTDHALRAAQIELIAGPTPSRPEAHRGHALDTRHPYHWASFQLIGDWR